MIDLQRDDNTSKMQKAHSEHVESTSRIPVNGDTWDCTVPANPH